MNDIDVPKLGDTILCRISTVYGYIKRVDDFGYDKHEFIVIAHFDGDGIREDRQVLISPVNESLFSIHETYGSFNLLDTKLFYSAVFDIKHFETIPSFINYDGKFVAWVYIENICEVVKNNIDYHNDGCFCKVCTNWYQLAVPNQPDGTLVCWSCRQYPMREFY